MHKSYGKVKAVQGITFGIDVGTCFGLLGINGAGMGFSERSMRLS